MSPHVTLKFFRQPKLSPTYLTLKFVIPFMGQFHMIMIASHSFPNHSALSTFVRLILMRVHMNPKVTCSHERFATQFACERFCACMCVQMTFQMAVVEINSVTPIAWILSLFGVEILVFPKIRSRQKHFCANITFVFLFVCMQIHVRTQIDVIGKASLANVAQETFDLCRMTFHVSAQIVTGQKTFVAYVARMAGVSDLFVVAILYMNVQCLVCTGCAATEVTFKWFSGRVTEQMFVKGCKIVH